MNDTIENKAPLTAGDRIAIAACWKDKKIRWKGLVHALDDIFDFHDEVAKTLNGRVVCVNDDHSMKIDIDNGQNGGERKYDWDFVKKRLEKGCIWKI